MTTVFTVGFCEIEPFDTAGKVFTMVLIAGGVGTALYSLSVLVELVIEGHLSEYLGRRRMDRDINRL